MCEEISFCGSAEREGIVGPGNGEEGGILSVSLEVSLRAYRVLYLFSKIGKSKIDLQTFLFLFVLKHKCNALQPLTINTNTHLLFYSPCRVKCMAYPWKELPGKPFDFWDLTFSLLVFLQRTARPTSYRNLLWGHTLFTNNWLRQEYCVHSKPSFLKKKKKKMRTEQNVTTWYSASRATKISPRREFGWLSPSYGNTIRIIVSDKNDSKGIYRKFHFTASEIAPVTYCGQLKTSEQSSNLKPGTWKVESQGPASLLPP